MNRKLKLIFPALTLLLPMASCGHPTFNGKSVSYNENLQVENFKIDKVYNSRENGSGSDQITSYLEYSFSVRNTGSMICAGFDYQLNFSDSVGNLVFSSPAECMLNSRKIEKSKLYFYPDEISNIRACVYGNTKYSFTSVENYRMADFSFVDALGYPKAVVYSTEDETNNIKVRNLRVREISHDNKSVYLYRIDFDVDFKIPDNKDQKLTLAYPYAKLVLDGKEYLLTDGGSEDNVLSNTFAYYLETEELDLTKGPTVSMKAALAVTAEANFNHAKTLTTVIFCSVLLVVLLVPVVLGLVLYFCFRNKPKKKEKKN